jgi:hypothetical protein
MNPFLSTLQPIWESPTCVWLNEDVLSKLGNQWERESLSIPAWREPVFPQEDSATFVNFLGVGNSINFAFTDFSTYESFSVVYKAQTWRGAFGMWACLLRALDDGIDVLNGHFLANLDEKGARDIFRGESQIPMLCERVGILREVGTTLETRYGGWFSNLFADAGYRAFGGNGIVDRLVTEFSSFVDESRHLASGTLLKFHKRAQLLAMMYQGRALASDKLERLADFEDLGPIADYAVPRALHNVGVLKYSPELQKKIESRTLIVKDSTEEQEIRAQTSHAQFRLLQQVNRGGKAQATMLGIDYKVWTLGRGAKEPHHLTVTTAY